MSTVGRILGAAGMVTGVIGAAASRRRHRAADGRQRYQSVHPAADLTREELLGTG